GATVFVTGESNESNGIADYATVAYDASTGVKRWRRRNDSPAHDGDAATKLAMPPNGSILTVTGWSDSPTHPHSPTLTHTASSGGGQNDDFATEAVSTSTGANLWVKRYNGPGDGFDSSEALAVAPDGSTVFVTGDSYGSSSYDYATAAYGVT